MLNAVELACLAFASYRATQLVVWDTITQPLRDRVELWHAKNHESRLRTFFRQLIACPYCVGWWLSMLAVAVYITAKGCWGHAPFLVFAVQAWAVAGAQALLNRWDDSRDKD